MVEGDLGISPTPRREPRGRLVAMETESIGYRGEQLTVDKASYDAFTASLNADEEQEDMPVEFRVLRDGEWTTELLNPAHITP